MSAAIVIFRWFAILAALWLTAAGGTAWGGVIFGHQGLAGGTRWDAAPRMVGSNERSLDGGLRYSLQGGSFKAYCDLFQWVETPTVEAFQLAVEQAFAAWTAVDPASGLHSDLQFVADLLTPVVGTGTFFGLDINGAEIDLLAADAEVATRRAVTGFDVVNDTVTLTSGTSNYPGSRAISGVDIKMNNNSGSMYTLDFFRRILTHEIGHALGLGDVEDADEAPKFIDDNYDGSTSATALATLTNSWALRVDPYNPAASTLDLYVVADGNPGIDTPGVNLLMESSGLGIAAGNPVTSLVPLTNDEFGTRQFLYPSLMRDVVVTGDYNGNGVVDAADYVLWRRTFGQTVFWIGDGADGDESGVIDEGDYEFWRARFGNVVSGSAGSGSTGALPSLSNVPEPAAAVLVAAALLAFMARPPHHTSGLAG